MEIDLQIPSAAIFSFVFLFLFICIRVRKSKSSNLNSKLPPGPWKIPFLGNIHQLGAMPHRSLAQISNLHGPLMHIKLGQLSYMVVSSPEMAKEVMKTHDLILADRPAVYAAQILTYGFKGISFSPYGSHWKQMRRICTLELLAPRRVESLRPIREKEVSNLIKMISMSSGTSVNLSKMINSFSYGLTSREAFGEKSEDQEHYISLMKEVTKLVAGFSIADFYPSVGFLPVLTGLKAKAEKVHQEVDRVLENIVRSHMCSERKEDKDKIGEDLVDVLLKLQKQNGLEHPLSNDIIKATILDIFGAGSGTSAKTIEWAMSELVKNPKVMQKAQTEIRSVLHGKTLVDEESVHELKYLKSVVKETMRLHPPVPLLLPRECRERCEINGFEIPEKSKVIVNIWAIGRDPKYWIEADKFLPERFLDGLIDYKGSDFQFLPFGAGRRICPGIAFGMANVEVTLTNLLYHFDWKLPDGDKPEELDMSESFGLSLRRKNDLQLVPVIYQPTVC